MSFILSSDFFSYSFRCFLLSLIFLFHSASFAGGKPSGLQISSEEQQTTKQIRNPAKFEEFIKDQNEILANSFGIERNVQFNAQSQVFYSFLSSEADGHARNSLDRILPLGSAGTTDQIIGLSRKDSSRTHVLNCGGIPGYCFDSFPIRVYGDAKKRTILQNPMAYFTVQLKVLGTDKVLFRFGAFVSDYREELVQPRLHDRMPTDASMKFVQAIDYGAAEVRHLVFKIGGLDPSIIARFFKDYEYTAIFPVNPSNKAQQEKKDMVLAEFKKCTDAVVRVKNALVQQEAITFSSFGRSSSGFRVANKSSNLNSAQSQKLTEAEILVNDFMEFQSLPLDLSERMTEQSKKKNNWYETPIAFYFEAILGS